MTHTHNLPALALASLPKIGRCLGAGVLLSVVAHQAVAQDVEPTTFWKRINEKGVYERLWEASRLYENEDNPVIQALSIIGRYHGQYSSVHANQGSATGWENRRLFVGAEAVLFRDVTVHAQIKVGEDLNPLYDGLYQAFVKWSPDDDLTLAAGRLDFLFAGMERSVSSTKIETFERGLLANQLMPGEVVGAGARFRAGAVTYRAGMFSGSIEQEFTSFAGGFGAVAGVGVDAPLFYETGSLHLEYLYNDGNPSNNALKPYDHVLTLWQQGRTGPYTLGVEMTWAHGIAGRTPVWGVTALGTRELSKNLIRKGDALEAALRYQYAASVGDDGLQLQSWYEQDVVPGGRGDSYHAVYAGLNFLLFGDRLKLMTGAEKSVMDAPASTGNHWDGWTYLAGVRVYF